MGSASTLSHPVVPVPQTKQQGKGKRRYPQRKPQLSPRLLQTQDPTLIKCRMRRAVMMTAAATTRGEAIWMFSPSSTVLESGEVRTPTLTTLLSAGR